MQDDRSRRRQPQHTRPQQDRLNTSGWTFFKLTPSAGKKYCLAFPSAMQSANDMAKALLTEIIPRWGISDKISSDKCTHFANEALNPKLFGIDIRKHCAYHTTSGGAIERENGSLKNKLAKCFTSLPWLKARPTVLMYTAMRRCTRTNLSPFEVMFAAPAQLGMTTGKKGTFV